MIISRTPFRVSLLGGGTDYPAWYRSEHGPGAVLGLALAQYCYVTARWLPPYQPFRHLIRYHRREEVDHVHEIQHPVVRETLLHLGVDDGVEIVHHGDVPARAGLGSSSAFTVGLLHALYALLRRASSKGELALQSIHIEQYRCGEAVGSQDQVLAAFGGLNCVDFGGVGGEVVVRPLRLPASRLLELESWLMLVYTGYAREAHVVAAAQLARLKENLPALRRIYALVGEGERLLHHPVQSLVVLGPLLTEYWSLKRGLAPEVSTPRIDEIHAAALAAGATGGKLLGAGGGGFLLFVVDPERRAVVRGRLRGLLEVPLQIDHFGSQIIYRADDGYSPEHRAARRAGLMSGGEPLALDMGVAA